MFRKRMRRPQRQCRRWLRGIKVAWILDIEEKWEISYFGKNGGEWSDKQDSDFFRWLYQPHQLNQAAMLVGYGVQGSMEDVEDVLLEGWENRRDLLRKFIPTPDRHGKPVSYFLRGLKFRLQDRMKGDRTRAAALQRGYGLGKLPAQECLNVGARTLAATSRSLQEPRRRLYSPVDVAGAIDRNRRSELVAKSIEELKPEYREIIELNLRDFTYQEIAIKLQISVENARQRFRRAKNELRKRVHRQLTGDSDEQKTARV